MSVGRVQHLASAGGPVRQVDINDFFITYRLCFLDKDKRPCNLSDCLILFYHAYLPLRAANSLSIFARTAFIEASKFSSNLTLGSSFLECHLDNFRDRNT